MTAVDETAPPLLDDLFGDLLDLIAGEVMPPPLRHTSDTDLYPVIEFLAGALAERSQTEPHQPARAGRLIRARRNRHQDVARPARRAVRRNRDTGAAVVLAETPAPVVSRYCRGARCRRIRDVGPSGYCPRCLRLSEDAADAYALIAPDWDDVNSERCGPVRVLVLWECQELTNRAAQAGSQASGVAA